MSFWSAINRFLTLLFAALVVVGIICIFTPKVRSLREMQSRKSELEQENRRLEMAINELRNNQERFSTDPAFVEWIAKKDLGMVRTNEVVFKFIPALEEESGIAAGNKK